MAKVLGQAEHGAGTQRVSEVFCRWLLGTNPTQLSHSAAVQPFTSCVTSLCLPFHIGKMKPLGLIPPGCCEHIHYDKDEAVTAHGTRGTVTISCYQHFDGFVLIIEPLPPKTVQSCLSLWGPPKVTLSFLSLPHIVQDLISPTSFSKLFFTSLLYCLSHSQKVLSAFGCEPTPRGGVSDELTLL